MSFFKYHNYNTASTSKINFTFYDGGNVFNVGHVDRSGSITVLDENGNLVWNKIYSFRDKQITFSKMIPIRDEYVLLGVENEKHPFVMLVTADGKVRWYKSFPEATVGENLYATSYYDRILIAYYDVIQNKSYVIAVSQKGKVISGKEVSTGDLGGELKVCGAVMYGRIFTICGNHHIKGEILGTIILMDIDLNIVESKYTPNDYRDPLISFDGIYCRDEKLLISGIWNSSPMLLLPYENRGISYPENKGKDTKYVLGQNYFLIHNSENEIVKSDYGFTHEFMKKMDVRSFSIDQIFKDEVLLHGIDADQNFSGFFENRFDNCKTSPLQPWNASFFDCKIQDARIELREVFCREDRLVPDYLDFKYSNDEVCKAPGSKIKFNEFSGLQTPGFYLQAAGSKGEDSTKGIHLRWSLGGKLGENHLPKGNAASTSHNFNKPDDFVKVYRAPYRKSVFSLDFSVAPQLVDESQKMWVYKFNNSRRLIHIYFKNKNKYAQVRQMVNPLTQPLQFIEKYGSELIEVQCKTDLFFAASLQLNSLQSSTLLQIEALSVANNGSASQQHLTYRTSYRGSEITSNYFNAENGKTIRFKAAGGFVKVIQFEFYSDFIMNTNRSQSWDLLGAFSLTLDSQEAFRRLDPLPDSNPVHGAWLRYNDKAYVNTENYKKKWKHESQNVLDRDIFSVVKNYISLSNAQQNPKANETLDINLAAEQNADTVTVNTDAAQGGQTEVSNLDILNMASLDYHVARMLGLGCLDNGTDVEGKEFIYLAEYITNKDLEIKNSDKTHQLLSMSLPVSTEIERLSLPVELLQLSKGMEGNNPNSASLYNSEGYSHNGKYRYISIYNKQVPDFQFNPTFFESDFSFDASSFTNPVYAGLEHRLVKTGETDSYTWAKPELCHDVQYINIDSVDDSFETSPIQIPNAYAPLYMHRQDRSGTYFYKGYGINWFSRAQHGEKELSIDTDIKPANKLLPPSGVNVFNIQKEYPLTFTTQNEQNRLQAIQDDDKTLVRLAYDYHIYQDMIEYSIPFDSAIATDVYEQDPDSVFPDNKEVFADEVEIFYRNYTPKIISAQAYEVLPHANQLMAIIKTRDYAVPGSGAQNDGEIQASISEQILKSEIPSGTTASDYIGGIFLMDSDSYVINGIDQTSTGLHFTVFKKAASEAIIAGTTPLIDQPSLVLPVINPSTEGFFSVTENMQNTSTWGAQNPNSLKVKLGTNEWTVHREVIETPLASGEGTQRYLEKSRGFWKAASVEKYFEELTAYQNSQGTVIDYPDKPYVHKGVYKITFPGFKLAQHSQFKNNSHSVEWQNGIVRLFTNEHYNNGNPIESRSVFKIVRTENIATNKDLILYIYDENFSIEEDDTYRPKFHIKGTSFQGKVSDPVLGSGIKVNYYPSYKVYLYKNAANNLIESAILPGEDEDVRYSIFGLRSVDHHTVDMQGAQYKSRFGAPAVLFANRIVEPKQPKQPTGSKYATRPDQFGKSAYSFITEYGHKPYSVQFFRANNTLLMGALYSPDTIQEIVNQLNALGGTEEMFFNDRWINFMDFEMLTNMGSTGYMEFPDVGTSKYTMPIPDSEDFLKAINAFITEHNKYFKLNPSQGDTYSQLLDKNKWKEGFYKINSPIIKAIPGVADELRLGHFIKERISACFLPLTEVPMIYQHIKNMDFSNISGHRPKNKKQNIRDDSGYLLPSTHVDFDMAPMAAVYSSTPKHSVLFTDFTLDGASNNFYFYGAKELGNQMQMGDFSTFLGPIRLVNTHPAEPPKIASLLPIVDNATLGITAKVRVEVNPYPEVQKITKVSLYRATNKLDADSILSMDHLKTVDLSDIEVDAINGNWVLYDEFEGMENKPYGDLLFYRVVVTRKVEYSATDYEVSPPSTKVVVEQAPSLPSKVVVSTLVENYNPPTPELKYHSEPVAIESDTINSVILSWDQVCYKGKYQLYKLSNQGNWKEIAKIDTDSTDSVKGHLSLLATQPSTNTEEWVFQETLDWIDNTYYLPLEKVHLDPMKIKDEDGNVLYHHFKLVAQNTSNMFSTQEKILTIYKKETWSDIGGISSDGIEGMITEGTFIIRP